MLSDNSHGQPFIAHQTYKNGQQSKQSLTTVAPIPSMMNTETKQHDDGKLAGNSSSSSPSRQSKSKKRSSQKKDKKRHHKQNRNLDSRHKHKSRSRSARRKDSRDRDRGRDRDRRRKRSRSRDEKRDEYKRRSKSRDRRYRYQPESDNKNLKKTNNNPPLNDNNDSQKPPLKAEAPKEVKMPLEIAMPPIPGERRRRQRSRSPRDYYRKNVSNNDGEFWDSFSWQPKLNYTPNVSSAALINTKKMRRLQITNIPLEMGLTENDINELVTKFMIKNYLNDNMNNCPIVNVQIFEADRSVAIELSSVEETCRVCQQEKVELFKGNISRIIRLGDSIYGASIVTQAQTAAQAQAAAFAAISIIQNKTTNFSVNSGMSSVQSSCVVRVCNAVTQYMSEHCTADQWKEYEDDLIDGFQPYGRIKHKWFVKPSQKMVGADPGNLFVQYETKEQAEKAMVSMQDRNYDQRSIKLFYIPDVIYQNHFKPQSLVP